KAAVAPVGSSTDESVTTADGRLRTFHVYVPSAMRGAVDGSPVPLLIALHGGGGSGTQFKANSGFDGLAEANGFVVVYPDGVVGGAAGNPLRTWNGGGCCGLAARQQVDDVGFVDLLIATLETRLPIDASRVYAAGHSNGGILAYRLACELSGRIVAIGVQSTAMEVPSCAPDHPVSVLHIHGTADQNIPIGGGPGTDSVSKVSFAAPIDGPRALAAADGCAATAEPPAVDSANGDLTTTVWSCPSGVDVRFVAVAGASHAWMGHLAGGSGKVGPVYTKLDSSLAIWTFLAQHHRT
ncbi:MAG: PHB depolymerase family esterase, partial [Ilumatobacteraceae bacterium]